MAGVVRFLSVSSLRGTHPLYGHSTECRTDPQLGAQYISKYHDIHLLTNLNKSRPSFLRLLE